MSFKERFMGLLGRRPEPPSDPGPGFGLGAEAMFTLPDFPQDPAPPQQMVAEAPEQYQYVGITHPVPEQEGDEPILGI